ncbi:outer membrane protein OmpA-like peptidoglycan-associated protein [Anseongella ginsenosidimutans]|uniref:Outer membrane protein OmpA-like peptidoglycan-associated protein n=1 Tax=Anseongella ginsenosidimutans TaxID=496056 RepID=A0A4R3KTQ1_9SPHI|nr:OmpA family protein [Anseongella ginsenosidimutans]QEC53262.1 OmpA family protein [Anseongella ginsenosidimutans]TCS87901.1 outer membrane protein OmpA-like peptidoglycan-associated protein [Anseongella ginsenosidimutans]
MKRLLLLFCVSFTFFHTLAQSTNSKKALQAYETAQQHIGGKEYTQALNELYKAIQEDPGFIEAYQVLGDIFRIQENHVNAVTNYRKVLEIKPDFSARTRYGLGVSLFHLEKYAEAKEQLKKFLQDGNPGSQELARVKKYIANCGFAETAIKSPVAFEPVNLGETVNSIHDEYLPAITVDGSTLVFTRKTQQGEDFYTSSRSDSTWSRAVFLSEVINTPVYNEGAEALSADGRTIYFTICAKPGGMGSCDIYYSRFNGSQWSAPLNLGHPVNSPAWESQPSLSPDGRTLYFASNRAGTLGGIDLWKSVLQEDGSWSKPVNLGPHINTPWEEQSPFIHPDNKTLYFTSEGWPGMGGKDIFFSRKKDGEWQKAENIGYPINTVKDESSLIISAGGKTAYFASNSLKGLGAYDLYTFEMPPEARPGFVSYVKGLIYDEATNAKLSARVQLINTANKEIVFESGSNELTGEFLASLPAGNNYAFNVSKPGYLFYSGSFFLEDLSASDPFRLDVPLKKIAKGEKIVLQNVFFETDSYKLKPESYAELDKIIEFMKQNPRVVIELSGHTDDVGTGEHNQQLSENRAKAAYAYLVRGILQPERFVYKGYGESQPLAENTTEEGRAKNRRTELKIVSE